MPLRILALASLALFPVASAEALTTEAGAVTTTAIVTGVDDAWGLAFLPDGGLLFTRKSGTLHHLSADGVLREVTGVPRVVDDGQGGLLDVMVPSDFEETREVYLGG